MNAAVHADAQAVLSAWVPPDDRAAAVREDTLTRLRDGPAAIDQAHQPGHITASALIVHADLCRVLLCLHGRIQKWVQTGGHCEPEDSSLAAAAAREAREESGITGLVLHPVPIDVDIHPVTCGGGRSWHYDVRFAALAPPDAVETLSAESHALGWFAPEDLPTPLASATEQLIAPALAAAGALRTPPVPG